jgi:hypothetical protein
MRSHLHVIWGGLGSKYPLMNLFRSLNLHLKSTEHEHSKCMPNATLFPKYSNTFRIGTIRLWSRVVHYNNKKLCDICFPITQCSIHTCIVF